MTRKRLSQRLLQLADAGHIHSTALHRGNNRRVYWPPRQPYEITRRDLTHDLIAAHMSIQLLGAGGTARLAYNQTLAAEICDQPRQWTRDAPLTRTAHLADGLLWLPDDTTVIVEIELTAKSPQRLAGVLDSHATRLGTDHDPAAHILYLATRRVGQLVAAAWRNNGHAADHPDAMQIIHAVDDTTLATTPDITTIPIPE
ncbi:hypothetical protein KO481_16900 [Nocardia sp. NEAU-G5]|uniref:Restriction endonuclease domain-containing protein n=1 Tax=Nocardia albiluteola TaxID=2842303 RepID=A0ABS6AYR5_9NOCA|nr:hypothetical protein [Nocardia albiluteola]MBU3063200.1 hypothetical protein [Nocardia albiluteola]